MRTTQEVIDNHLESRRDGDLEGDLVNNYADDVVLLSYEGVNHGHNGVRKLAGILDSYVSVADYSYDAVIVHGEYALLRWSANGNNLIIHDGVDSFVVHEGKIVLQTIHYSTKAK